MLSSWSSVCSLCTQVVPHKYTDVFLKIICITHPEIYYIEIWYGACKSCHNWKGRLSVQGILVRVIRSMVWISIPHLQFRVLHPTWYILFMGAVNLFLSTKPKVTYLLLFLMYYVFSMFLQCISSDLSNNMDVIMSPEILIINKLSGVSTCLLMCSLLTGRPHMSKSAKWKQNIKRL